MNKTNNGAVKTASEIEDNRRFIQQLKARDKSAFRKLVEQYQTKIYNLGIKMLINKEDAEDILQETFIKVYGKIDSFREEADIATWIYRIATNAALMKLRERRRLQNRLSDIDETHEIAIVPSMLTPKNQTPFDHLLQQESKEILDKAIAELPDIYRVVFVLKDIERLPTPEISKILDLGHEAIYSRLKRARIQLRNTILHHYNEKNEETSHGLS